MTPPDTVVTRFAPSPTGYLHIGGARTALFNWLFARHHGGRFLLRIEDTDRARSTEDAIRAIRDGMAWLGLDWDGEPVSQFSRRDRHAAAAQRLLDKGLAYHCYCTKEELAEMREAARREGRPQRYDGRWRDRDPSEAPEGVPPVVRFRAPQDGSTTIEDAVQGPVTVANDQLDDMVLLRADGTPTYMLAVVVDDIEMGVTHVIRGDDHLTNAFRQLQLFNALEAAAPVFGHVPLIHGPDGAKYSKRHGATGLEAFRDQGYLPAALRNYLVRLGWAHGDDEVFSTEQAIQWFDFDGMGKSAARFDFAKLENLNGVYIRGTEDAVLVDLIAPRLADAVGRELGEDDRARLLAGMDGLKQRTKTLNELAENAAFYVRQRPLELTEKAAGLVSGDAVGLLERVANALSGITEWDEAGIEAAVRETAETEDLKLGKVAQPLRAALTGSTVSPGIFEVAAVLGRDESLGRLADITGNRGG